MALKWTYQNNNVASFDIFRHDEFMEGSQDVKIGTVNVGDYTLKKNKNGELVYDENGKTIRQYSFVDPDRSQDSEYSYRLQVNRINVPPRSIPTKPLKCKTRSKYNPKISLSDDELIVPENVTIALNAGQIAMRPGKSNEITATLTPAECLGHVEWSSDNPAVATVAGTDSESGKNLTARVTGVGEGNATITATYKNDNGYSVSATLPCTVSASVSDDRIYGASLELKESLAINFYCQLSSVGTDDRTKDHFALKCRNVNKGQTEADATLLTKPEEAVMKVNNVDTTLYRFRYSNIAAKQMGDEIDAQLMFDSDGDGTFETKVGEMLPYSVKTYAMNKIQSTDIRLFIRRDAQLRRGGAEILCLRHEPFGEQRTEWRAENRANRRSRNGLGEL